MKLTISNVTRNNVTAIKALVRVALNQACTVMMYEVTDSDDALWRQGYKAAHDLYWNADISDAKRDDYFPARLTILEQATNPFEEQSPQWFGWKRAIYDARNNSLYHVSSIERYVLTVEFDAPGDMSLLFRFAHQLGQVYRNCVVTMN